MIVNIRKI
jgi:hypothetical protein